MFASSLRPILVIALLTVPVRAQEGDDFLREELEVVTPSRRARSVRMAPATVYVVTGRQIRESGAHTLWEALRGVPGLDVMSTRSMHGEIGIRGLNQPINDRTLVLLDGRPALAGFINAMLWESLPIPLEEIDRVEIVEGPVSALYGANAFSGVINIITKRPEAVGRANVSVSAGTERALFGSAMTGRTAGPNAYKLSLGWRQAEHHASRAGSAHGLFSRELGELGSAQVSAGAARHATRLSVGSTGVPLDDGVTGFVRGDWSREGTRARAFWNFGRTRLREFSPEVDLDYDTWDVEAQHTFELPASNALTAGAGYRRNSSSSELYGGSPSHHQDLWSLFFEDVWRAHERWTLDVSGRLDRHPHTGLRFSPRGAVVFEAAPGHAIRFSGGSAYRNPTLIDNYVELTRTAGGAQVTSRGSQSLDPESITQYELAYLGRIGRYNARLSGFHYVGRDFIVFGPAMLASAGPPPAYLLENVNVDGAAAWGYEAALEAAVLPWLTAYGAYSYQCVHDRSDLSSVAASAPRHKASGSLNGRRGGWSGSVSAHWTSRTGFRGNPVVEPYTVVRTLPDYWLINARLAYAFSGRWSGLEAAVSVYNMADDRRYELIPAQNGELLGRRVMGTLSWRLP